MFVNEQEVITESAHLFPSFPNSSPGYGWVGFEIRITDEDVIRFGFENSCVGSKKYAEEEGKIWNHGYWTVKW